MNIYKRFFISALLIALAISASAAQITVPKNTVIPVTLDTPLSSATSNVGDTFYAYHTGINGGGFPEYSNFAGRVDSVTKASGKTAGQIGVSFNMVHLPDGTSIPIDGQLISLDQKSVKTNPDTGRLEGTVQAAKADLKFIAIGAGAGLLIGELVGKKPLIGTILGAAAGYLYGNSKTKPAIGKDVVVAAGTKFGVLLMEDVSIPEQKTVPTIPPTETTPVVGPGWKVAFTGIQPKMSGNDLMLPFRFVMEAIDMPFEYDAATKTIRMTRANSQQQLYTAVGTKLVYVNGIPTKFDTASKYINGDIYVPATFIELLTQRTTYWNQKQKILRIE